MTANSSELSYEASEAIFIDKFEDAICSICKNYFRDPVQCMSGHSFCRSCITRSLTFKKMCPIDRTALNVSQLIPNICLRNLIDNLRVRCNSGLLKISDEEYCEWTGIFADLNKHIENCPHINVICNKVVSPSVLSVLLRKCSKNLCNLSSDQLEDELRNVAKMILPDYENCNYNYDHDSLVDKIKTKLTSKCQWLGPRRKYNYHIHHECPNRIVTCSDCQLSCSDGTLPLHRVYCSLREVKKVVITGSIRPFPYFFGVYSSSGKGKCGWPIYKKENDSKFSLEYHGSEWQLTHSKDLGKNLPIAVTSGNENHLHKTSSQPWQVFTSGHRETTNAISVSLLTKFETDRLMAACPVKVNYKDYYSLSTSHSDMITNNNSIRFSGIYVSMEFTWNNWPVYQLVTNNNISLSLEVCKSLSSKFIEMYRLKHSRKRPRIEESSDDSSDDDDSDDSDSSDSSGGKGIVDPKDFRMWTINDGNNIRLAQSQVIEASSVGLPEWIGSWEICHQNSSVSELTVVKV